MKNALIQEFPFLPQNRNMVFEFGVFDGIPLL